VAKGRGSTGAGGQRLGRWTLQSADVLRVQAAGLRQAGRAMAQIVAKVRERFVDEQTPQKRISAIGDQVLLKVKVGRATAPGSVHGGRLHSGP
jgi:hypothetical protein